MNAEREVVRLRCQDGDYEDVEVLFCLLDDDHFGVDLRSVETDRRYNVLARNASLMKDLPVPLYRRETLDRPIDEHTLPEPPATEPHRLILGIELPPCRVKNGTNDVLSDEL